jgi:hypothetical protein
MFVVLALEPNRLALDFDTERMYSISDKRLAEWVAKN